MQGFVTEARQMIEGKLGNEAREPLYTQVVIEENRVGDEIVPLIYEDGVFGSSSSFCTQEN